MLRAKGKQPATSRKPYRCTGCGKVHVIDTPYYAKSAELMAHCPVTDKSVLHRRIHVRVDRLQKRERARGLGL